MRKRHASATVGLIAAILMVAIVIAVYASGGSGSTGNATSFGHSLERIRARNLRLRSMIAVLTERQTLRIGGSGFAVSSRPEQATKIVSHKAKLQQAAPAEALTAGSECDPNYEGACLDPNASDYDCEGGDGNGPDYTGEVKVVGVDHFGLDADGDGIGCEAE